MLAPKEPLTVRSWSGPSVPRRTRTTSTRASLTRLLLLRPPPLQDSCILFKSTEGSPAQAVALLQARERAQAELLAARRRIEEEEAKAKEEAARNCSHHAAPGGGAVAGSMGEPPAGAGDPSQMGTVEEPSAGSGKAKKPSVAKRRAARRPTPVGHRPVTRQARALSRGSQ